jgi:glutamine synthetase
MAKQVFGTVGNPFSDATTSSEIIDLIQKHEIEFVDVRFCDLIGAMQHFTITSRYLDQDAFDQGLPFDGSSVRGFQAINESDLALLPDPTSVTIDPFRTRPTIIINATVHQPLSLETYSRDPRTIAAKAEQYLIDSGIADTAYIGPEAEFFIFDSARFGQDVHGAFYEIDSIAGSWNADREFEADGSPNLAYKPAQQGGYFVLPPADKFQDLRSDMTAQLEAVGVHVEVQHHEVGTAGQGEIDMKYDTILHMADKMQMYKYVIKNVAAQAGYTVTFMPKPLFQVNGSGMHTHQSLWKDGVNLFYEDGAYANLSQMAKHYIAGIIEHGPALCALTNPTTNSYKRLTPGYEAPINLVYSQRNRSACLRIPLVRNTMAATRVEYRTPDPTANPYLAYSALVMAGLDGIKRGLEPGEPSDFDLFEADEKTLSKIKTVPASLEGALDALEADHEFLMQGDVFTQDVIDTWIEEKRSDADEVRLRPHPWEFQLYYNY